ncbi:hypothetical protein IT072_10740 [Leifsonia sp. ZF2019]|uniref:hypothetical protein n=1 Tax=Leifsonia sp. ZF2019 TaxID=2781978 RepID=UPI001CBBBEDC|nr:hypothetical protein [Leifsonia sp. ZF2019]UAJ77789.1 hypothetical protein IT072_10740 [Leifsonia sp. ZF2019]
MDDEDDSRARDVAPEHRWPAVIATLVALACYALLPSVVPALERYLVVGVCLLMLVALIIYNPHRLSRESRWSRWAEFALAMLILVVNQVAFVETIVRLLNRHGDGADILLASLQVWVTNVIAFALVFWTMDRGGPVVRVTRPRHEIPLADFRFPQDEDQDTVEEVARGSSRSLDWVPNYIDYFYSSLSNSMAFSATDAMPLTHRAKLLMALESFSGFVLLALVIARAVSLIG